MKFAFIISFVYLLLYLNACSPSSKVASDRSVPEEMIDTTMMYADINEPCILESENFKRKVIKRDIGGANNAFTYLGKGQGNLITIRLWINKIGIPTDARIIREETDVKNVKVLKAFLNVALNYRFAADENGIDNMCGKIFWKSDDDPETQQKARNRLLNRD